MGRFYFPHRLLLAGGAALLILFLGSISRDLVAKPDEVCDWCGQTMALDFSMETGNATLYIYQCECTQRGQKSVINDGRTEWIEW